MSTIRESSKARELPGANVEAKDPGAEAVDVEAVPFTPRRMLVVFMGILLIALFVGMMTLYFKTVYPYRNLPHVTEKDTPAVPAAPAR